MVSLLQHKDAGWQMASKQQERQKTVENSRSLL